jgi:hypothetical protein
VSIRNSNRRGYVLVLTLAVLVLVAGALASTGRIAVRRAAAAREARRELQRRVGVASIRRAVLPWAEQILAEQEARRNAPMPQHRAAVRLGGFTFDLIISDEQAKANVNSLLESAAPDVVENRLREALSGTGLLGAVALRPVPLGDRLVVSGMGQVFDLMDPQKLLDPRGGKGAVTELLTCWGSGAINVRRASEASLRLSRCPPWTQLDVSRLMQARRDLFGTGGPDRTPLAGRESSAQQPSSLDVLARLLRTAKIRTGPAGVTAGSTCHSLWIIVRDGRRQWYHLAVHDAVNYHSFSW